MTIMTVPSGRTLDNGDLQLLARMNSVGFIRWSDEQFTLKSGIKSHVYVQGRQDLTDHPWLLSDIGEKVAHVAVTRFRADSGGAWPKRVHPNARVSALWREDHFLMPCLIGIPVAGTTLALAASMSNIFDEESGQNIRIPTRMMRQALKAYGAHKTWVDGEPDLDRHRYMTVDNVVTIGTSKFEAFDRLAADGYKPKEMTHIIFVDRQQGGVQNMQKAGYANVVTVFNLLDVTHAFGELGLWPEDAVKRVSDEIEAHKALV